MRCFVTHWLTPIRGVVDQVWMHGGEVSPCRYAATGLWRSDRPVRTALHAKISEVIFEDVAPPNKPAPQGGVILQ